MSDEMPTDILRQCLHFLAQFLFVALAECALAFDIGSLDIFVGMVLADSHKTDALR